MNKLAVVITGVAGGIGRATAESFSYAGWYVIGIDLEKTDRIPGVDLYIHGDISQPETWVKISEKAQAEAGRIDVIVNNAAMQLNKRLTETTPEEWNRVMAVNVGSVYLSARFIHPLMCSHGGAIVNVCSVHATATSANIAAYASSKGAVLALTRALAVELACDGIRVNAVLPGAVDTKMLREGMDRGHLSGAGVQEKLAALGARTPLGRVGRPEEIAQAILFLADNDRSSFITGEALVVDGGALARLSTE
jgi:NAD(P)-dependent dehydrogenase (short-subunit alcohol dehydrogenase family)